jgi:hypothetical protein
MSQIFALYNQTTNADISSDICSCGDVGVCERNRDFTLVSPSFKMTSCTGEDPASINDIIEVSLYGSSYPFFIGYVNRRVYNTETERYDYDVVSVIEKLRGEVLSAANITSLLTSVNFDEYNPSDAESLPNVQMFYFIKTIFEAFTGYTLTHSLSETVIETKTPIIGAGEKTFKFKHLCMDLNMIYTLGDCYNIFSLFCSSLKLGLALSQTGTARQFVLTIHSNTGYSFDDDFIYKKSLETIEGKAGGYRISAVFEGDRANFTGANPPNEVEQGIITSGDGLNDIPFVTNFIMPYRDLREADGTGYIYPMVGSEMTGGSLIAGRQYIVTLGTINGHEVGTLFTAIGNPLVEIVDTDNRCYWSDLFVDTCYSLAALGQDYRQMNAKVEAEVGDFTATEITYKHIIDNSVNMVYNKINMAKQYSECYQEVLV